MEYKCGHEIADLRNLGRGASRQKRLEAVTSHLCPECHHALLLAESAKLTMLDGSPRPAEANAAWVSRRMADYHRKVERLYL